MNDRSAPLGNIPQQTVKFYTLGCKVNQYETQLIREQMLCSGFRELADGAPADVYVINTCTVTRQADTDSFYLIRKASRDNSQARIIVTGCLAELDRDKILSIGRGNLIVKSRDCFAAQHGITYFKGRSRAFLKIQDGCNYVCSYCKVRLVRGKSRSREYTDVLSEVKTLIKNGYREIVLCGICLGAYGKDLTPRLSLAKLIAELEMLSRDFRIRLSSIEAGDINQELIATLKKSFCLCRHLHIPLQSGDNAILKRMNRQYTRESFLRLIRQLKALIPQIGISTDVMVGFPGETDANFENTLELVREIEPLRVHIFAYSPRQATAAANLKGAIAPGIIKSRVAALKKIARACWLNCCRRMIAEDCNVLIEQRILKSNLWQGYTDNYIRVRLRSKCDLKNRIVRVRLKKAQRDFVAATLA